MRTIDIILKEINEVISNFNEEEVKSVANLINNDTRIFVDGEGRSGFQAKGFAMRLMHIGYRAFVMGETITPSLKREDVYIAISGSGTTRNVLSNVRAAKELGLTIIAVTSKKSSELGKIADCVIEVPGSIKQDRNNTSIQLLSSLFDQATHIVLDDLCLLLSKRDNLSKEEVLNNHVNVE